MLRQVAQRLASTARRGISTSAICREGEDKGPKGMQQLVDSMTCIQKPAVNGSLQFLVVKKAQPSSKDLQQIEGLCGTAAFGSSQVHALKCAALLLCRVPKEVQAACIVHNERPMLSLGLSPKGGQGGGRGLSSCAGQADPKLLPPSRDHTEEVEGELPGPSKVSML